MQTQRIRPYGDDRERRNSRRWATDKPLRWRVFRGRRVRSSRMVERSLDGMVLLVDPRDVPQPGTRLLACDAIEFDRLGFRSAVVTRTTLQDDKGALVFAQIEA